MLELKSGVELDGRYVVHGPVGTGGFAMVWRAVDKQLNRPVALKRLLKHSHMVASADVAALMEEAQRHAQLIHTNIVQVYTVIEADGEPLIVMEYVDGQSLEALLRDRALRSETVPLDTAIAIVRDLLEGVASAHAKGICHRDLSPANILLTSTGTPKIGDFGIAIEVATESSLAEQRAPGLPGTGNTNYMSPEQARGESADFASDLFMIGILGYLLLTGRHPFAHPSGLFEISELLRKDDYNPDLPKPSSNLSVSQQRLFREYAAVIVRLLQREKAGRFASARDAVDAIDAVTPSIDCPDCGERVPDHYKFCGACGARLDPTNAAGIGTEARESDTADDLVEKGYKLSLAKKWSDAIQRYNGALAKEPGHKKALRNLAYALNQVGRHEDALATLDVGLAQGALLPEHRASMLFQRSLANQKLRRYDEAYVDIQTALSLEPGSLKFLYARARLQEFRSDFEQAKIDAKEILKRIPDHTGALRLLSQYDS
jgi:serine/threonine protein kinase